jgi:hypothetical protein
MQGIEVESWISKHTLPGMQNTSWDAAEEPPKQTTSTTTTFKIL